MMNKTNLLALCLMNDGTINDYVVLLEDKLTSKKYFKYAFKDGYPEHFDDVPEWAINELKTNEVYELSGYTGHSWALKDSAPVSVPMLLNKKFSLSVNDISNMLDFI
jgi:hypothetical protein